jgi:arsenate reductase
MPNVIIYHNPKCTKSRQTLALIEEAGIKPKVIEYLRNPPTVNELAAILKKLKITVRELMRKNESVYKELDLADESLSERILLKAMVEHPILIERPIVINGNKACLGRSPENVLEIL